MNRYPGVPHGLAQYIFQLKIVKSGGMNYMMGYRAFFSKLEFMIEVKVRDSTSDRRLTRIICLCCMDIAYACTKDYLYSSGFFRPSYGFLSCIASGQVHMIPCPHFLFLFSSSRMLHFHASGNVDHRESRLQSG